RHRPLRSTPTTSTRRSWRSSRSGRPSSRTAEAARASGRYDAGACPRDRHNRRVNACLRVEALHLLLERDPDRKVAGTRGLDPNGALDPDAVHPEPGGIPGRPERPLLVAHTELRARSAHSREGRATLLHAIAHIELNAVDLALDACLRFAGLPD